MMNVEATTTENDAAVALQGATAAAETTTSSKGASRKPGAPMGGKATQGKSPVATPKRIPKPEHEDRQTRKAREACDAAREQQELEDHGSDQTIQRRGPSRNCLSGWLAEARHSRLLLGTR